MMKRKCYLMFLLTTFAAFKSCSSVKEINQKYISGTYEGAAQGIDKKTHNKYILHLTSDSSFHFEYYILDANPECDGRWNFVNDIFFSDESSPRFQVLPTRNVGRDSSSQVDSNISSR